MIKSDLFSSLPNGEMAQAPFRVLVLDYYHHTMDMSVANYTDRRRMIIIPPNPRLPIESEDWCGCGKTTIVGFDNDGCPILKWHGMEYVACKDEVINTKTVYLDNPYLSHEEVSMSYEYIESIDAINVMLYSRSEVREWQEKRATLNTEMEDNRDIALQSLWYAIDKMGYVGYYPTYALMKSCRNWASFTITDWEEFAKIMKEAIKADCFNPLNDYAVCNFSEILRFNKEEEVYKKVPFTKEAIEKMADGGNELAQMMLECGIEYIEKTSREDSEFKHYTLTIEGEEDEYIEHYYNLLVDDEIVAGTTIDLGEYGQVSIAAVSEDAIDIVWQNETCHLEENFYRHILTPVVGANGKEVDFTIRYYKQNLWKLLCDSIFSVELRQVSNIEEKKATIQQKKERALRLVQKLIDKGDKDLEALAYAMKENEEWKCFDFDGELRYLLQ